MNRLKLDFSLSTIEERKNFLDKYIKDKIFDKKPPTEDELETMANYLLWGKDSDGKNLVQKKEIQIQTRNKTWDRKEEDSLEALLEAPSFNESQILELSTIQAKTIKNSFSRKEALEKTQNNPLLFNTFKELFQQIDTLELSINFYDLAHEKRKNPPREQLLKKFSLDEQNNLKKNAESWNQYTYLKKRHLLVELRKQQFTLKDSYAQPIIRNTIPIPQEEPLPLSFESDIEIFPLGLLTNQEISSLIFKPKSQLIPENFSEQDLQKISKFYWLKKEFSKEKTKIDFREIEHVYNIFLQYFNLEDSSLFQNFYSTTDSLLKTLLFYIEMAELTEVQKEILNLKIRKVKNQNIADYINQTYEKSYTANYISTIFRQKIIAKINSAAALHERIISNLFFPEEFKKCSSCGEILLRDSENFVRKSRAKDGLSNRCKKCDKKDRKKKKEEKGGF